MEKKIVELVCLLDKSVSMHGSEKEVIGTYNSLIESYKEKEEKCYVTTCLFSDVVDVVYLHNEISCVRPLTERDYFVEGGSAFFDAVQTTFHQVEECLQYVKSEIDKQINVYVITDGIDTSSVKMVYEEFADLLSEKRAHGWTIKLMEPGKKSSLMEFMEI